VWLLREVLIVSSQERALHEPRRWLLDGFPLFWILREHSQVALADDEEPALRALYGTQSGLSLLDLDQWLTFRERVGEDIATGVAWSGLRVLSRRYGPEVCQRVLRRVLGRQPPKDIRAALERPATSLATVLPQEARITMTTFLGQWQDELAAARRSLEKDVKALPRVRGEVSFVPLSPDSRKVRYRVNIEPQPTAPMRYSLLYHLLSAFDEEVEAKSIQREQNAYTNQVLEELPETYSRGARLYWTFALEVPQLGCQVISGWKRQEIR
jgi:hypothetical protein